jgi:hypothetical protein
MSLNIILNVLMVLVQNRFNGSIMSILISIPIGTLLAYLFTKGMSRYPNKGLPEIFEEVLPPFISNVCLIFLAFMWIASGSFALISFSYIIKLYLMSEMDMRFISGFLACVYIFGATRKTQSILYKSEITLNVAFLFIAFIIFKTLSSDQFYMPHIFRMLHYTWQMPNYSSIAAATYIFTGYINLVIINRYIDSKKMLTYFWIVPVCGSIIAIVTFLIPIGFFGVKAIGDFVFPWMVTADAIRMQYGFVERLVFILIFVFLILSLLFGIVTWHIGFELFKGVFKGKGKKTGNKSKKTVYPVIFLSIVGVLTVVLQEFVNQREFFQIIKLWFNFRFPTEIILALLVFLFSLRRKNA